MSQVPPRKFFASLDIDFFACQVWAQEKPELQGHPLIVYNKNGGQIISVNNLAVDNDGKRLSRKQTYQEARRKAANPEALKCFEVPIRYGKSSQSEMRKASHHIEDCLVSYIETHKPNITITLTLKDEFGLDITGAVLTKTEDAKKNHPNSVPEIERHVSWIGDETSATLEDRIASQVVSEILTMLETSTGFHASAGVGPSLIVAKLARELNKPNGLSVVPGTNVDLLFQRVKLRDTPEFRERRGEMIEQDILKAESHPISLKSFKDLAKIYQNGEEMYHDIFANYDKRLFNERVCETLWHIAMGKDLNIEHQPKNLSSSYSLRVTQTNDQSQFQQVFSWAAEEMVEILREELRRKKRTPIKIKFNFEWKSSRPKDTLALNFQIDPSDQENFELSPHNIQKGFEERLEKNENHEKFKGNHNFEFISNLKVTAEF